MTDKLTGFHANQVVVPELNPCICLTKFISVLLTSLATGCLWYLDATAIKYMEQAQTTIVLVKVSRPLQLFYILTYCYNKLQCILVDMYAFFLRLHHCVTFMFTT